jgi:HlyD family secretion protein
VKRYFSILLLPLLIAAVVAAPFDVPFTVDSAAKVLPLRHWALLKARDGALVATLYDHRTGLVSNQNDFQFDRGDQVQVRFKEGWKSGDQVRTGEKVATISSNRLGEELIKLRNQLAVEEANLGVVASGQKPQVIGQSEEEVNLAKADLALRKQNLDRTRQLHVDGLIPLTQLEQAENTYNESLARLRIAEKSLQVQSTGEKPEAVSLALSRITSLRREIAFLEGKSNRYVVNAPFDGQVRFEITLEGERLLVEDDSTVILQIPLRLRDRPFLKQGQNVEVQLMDNQITMMATILEVGSRVELLNQEQVVMVKAIAERETAPPLTAVAVPCRIVCGKVRVMEFLKRSIRWQ